MAGWGQVAFSAGDHWWWVPLFVCPIGGVLGGLCYQLLVGWHHPAMQHEPHNQTAEPLLSAQ